MIYKIEEIEDERNRALYEEVNSRVRLEFHEQSAAEEQEGWGAQYFPDKGVAAIRFAPTKHPHSCFAHELLHIKNELDGYQRPKHFAVHAPPAELQAYQRWAETFFVWAYNQLMHRRMLPQFVALGFKEDQFLRDNPGRMDRMQAHVKKVQGSKARKGKHQEHFVRTYLSLRNPDSDPVRAKKLLDQLKRVSRTLYNEIEEFMDKWIAAESPDVSWCMARLYNICGHPNVGVGNDPKALTMARDCTSNT